MGDTIKVHTGLKSADRDSEYHFGHFEMDFEDGALRFELIGRLCDDPACHCDNVQLTWRTRGQDLPTWYTAEHEWLDLERKPMPDDIASVFRGMEATEAFQERYRHMMFLRRREILATTDQLNEPFTLRIPAELIGRDGDPANGILGKVASGTKGEQTAYTVDFCDDPKCYCRNLFLRFLDESGQQRNGFLISPSDEWQQLDNQTDTQRLRKLRKKLQSNETFRKLLNWLRAQRQYQNYQRYVEAYPKETGVRIA